MQNTLLLYDWCGRLGLGRGFGYGWILIPSGSLIGSLYLPSRRGFGASGGVGLGRGVGYG